MRFGVKEWEQTCDKCGFKHGIIITSGSSDYGYRDMFICPKCHYWK